MSKRANTPPESERGSLLDIQGLAANPPRSVFTRFADAVDEALPIFALAAMVAVGALFAWWLS